MDNYVISSGMITSGNILTAGDKMYVYDGGVASDTTIQNGYMHISGAGQAFEVTVDRGALNVFSGGWAAHVTINSQGSMFVLEGGKVLNVIENGGYISVEDGADVRFLSNTFSGLTVMGKTTVHSNTIAEDILIKSKGQLVVYTGGSAVDIEVASSGTLAVSSGGTVNGAVVQGVMSNWLPYHSAVVNIYAGGTGNDIQVKQAGFLYIHGKGTANNVSIEKDGCIYILDGGTANATTLVGGNMNISSGGTANNTKVWGGLNVYDGSLLNGTVIESGGSMSVKQGAVTSDTTVNMYGKLHISSGGTASGIKENGGAVYVGDDANVAFAANTFSGLQLTGTATVHSATIADDTLVADYGVLVVSGGVANRTILASPNGKYGGRLEVYSGGTANSTTVSSRGSLKIFENGVASDSIVSGGNVYISNGGAAENTALDNGLVYIYNGGTASNTNVKGGKLFVSGGVAWDTIADGGGVNVCAGGTASNTDIINGGSMFVSSGGVAENAVVSSGHLYVSDGGRVKNGDFQNGIVVIYQGGSGSGLTVGSNCSCTVASGASALAIVESGGFVQVEEGAAVTFTPHTIDDLSVLGTSATLHSGAVANNVLVSAGRLYVYDGGVINDAAVEGWRGEINIYSGGAANAVNTGAWCRLTVYNGGVVENVCVEDRGYLIVSGGTVTGKLTLQFDASAVIYDGGIINFDLSQAEVDDEPLINSLARIEGSPVYTVTVTADLNAGTYKLAGGANSFDGVITVGDGTVDYGEVALDKTLQVNGVSYSLSNTDGNLNLTIANCTRFLVGAFDGAADMLMAVNGKEVAIYGNGGTWSEFTLEDGWDVVAVEDFNHDDRTDILRKHASGLIVSDISNGDGTFSGQVVNLLGSGWNIEDTGDFDGDGNGDVLVANPEASEVIGLIGYWKDAATWTLIDGYSPEWDMISADDFNGDGVTDMLWRNTFTGEDGNTYNAYCSWIMNNSNSWRIVSSTRPDQWDYLCSGDFDGDGTADMAMIDGNGIVGIWGIKDGTLAGWAVLGTVDLSTSQLAGVGDFNGDGTDDIAWCDTAAGVTGYWQIKNNTFESWQSIAVGV